MVNKKDIRELQRIVDSVPLEQWYIEHEWNIKNNNKRGIANSGSWFDSSDPQRIHDENIAYANFIATFDPKTVNELLQEIKRMKNELEKYENNKENNNG